MHEAQLVKSYKQRSLEWVAIEEYHRHCSHTDHGFLRIVMVHFFYSCLKSLYV